jgi:hypothetical protein
LTGESEGRDGVRRDGKVHSQRRERRIFTLRLTERRESHNCGADGREESEGIQIEDEQRMQRFERSGEALLSDSEAMK